MFGRAKSRRYNREAIAEVVLASTTDPEIFAGFLKEFGTSKDQQRRLLFNVIIFAYCWSRGWATRAKDVRVSEAYNGAAEVIASRFRDAMKVVRVSDYIVSPLEISQFYFELYEHFQLQIPLVASPELESANVEEAHDEAIRCYEVRFDILMRTVVAMRNKKMVEQISSLVDASLDVPGVLMFLSTTLYEQISGVTPMDLSRDPDQLHEELSVSQPRRLLIIEPLLHRLSAGLDSL